MNERRQLQNEVWISTIKPWAGKLHNGHLTHYSPSRRKLYRRKAVGPNVQNKHNMLHQIISLRTGRVTLPGCELAPDNFRARKRLFHVVFMSSILKSCIFMSFIFTPCDFDGPSFYVLHFQSTRYLVRYRVPTSLWRCLWRHKWNYCSETGLFSLRTGRDPLSQRWTEARHVTSG